MSVFKYSFVKGGGTFVLPFVGCNWGEGGLTPICAGRFSLETDSCSVMQMPNEYQRERGRNRCQSVQSEETIRHIFFQSTHDYGKQLLQAALVLRRSLRYDLEPNHELSRRLNQVWKRFAQGINERTARLNKVHIFNRNADLVSSLFHHVIKCVSRPLLCKFLSF